MRDRSNSKVHIWPAKIVQTRAERTSGSSGLSCSSSAPGGSTKFCVRCLAIVQEDTESSARGAFEADTDADPAGMANDMDNI